MRPVLLLVDLQNDFLEDIVEPPKEALLLQIEGVLQFFRSRKLPVVHVRMETTLDPDNRMPHWKEQGRTDCLKGSHGAEAPKHCDALEGEPIFLKPFFSAFGNGDLHAYLESLEVDCLVLAGVNTHVCVKQTALDAYSKGYSVRLTAGAVGSYDPVSGALAERYLAERGMGPIVLSDLVNALETVEKPIAPSGNDLPSAILSGTEQHLSAEVWSHRSPADASCLWSCRFAGAEMVGRAVARSRPAQKAWWLVGAPERRKVLERFSALLQTNQERLAGYLVSDIGKPLHHARVEMKASIAMLEAVLRRFEEDLRCSDSRWRRRPVGTVALVTPFNNPIMIPVGKFGPALAFGNAVVWKPSLPGWRVALEVVKLLMTAGLPSDVLKVICGDGSTAQSLMEHPEVDAVTLSGGMRAGFAATAICSSLHRPLQAELGGNNAAIAWGELDWPRVAAQVVRGAFGFAGQRCTANRRFIVPEHAFDEVLLSLRQVLETYPFGDPSDELTDCGPLVSAAHLERVRTTLRLAERAGASSFSMENSNVEGYFQSPTVLWNASAESHLVQEESFGPLLVIQKATDFRHAIRLSNGVRHGLVASLFCPDPNFQKQFLQGARAGILKLNQPTHGAQPDVPFGGWKATGLGPPEHGPGDAEFYTRYQALYGERPCQTDSRES